MPHSVETTPGATRRTKTSLILVPGLLCDAAVWNDQVAAFSGLMDVSVPILSDLDSIPAMAERVLAAAPPRFALAGHSLGGRIALEIYNAAPERIERLALLDTGVHPPQPSEPQRRLPLVELAHAQGMEALARRWIPPMVHPDRLADAQLMTELTSMVCRTDPRRFGAQIQALLQRPDAAHYLTRITCPTLVLCGREDGWSPPDQHREIAASIPTATLTIIENSGHMTTMEQPLAVTAALRIWLNG